MPYQLETITKLAAADVRNRISALLDSDAARYRRLWDYYRNPATTAVVMNNSSGSERPYRMAQEWGLPSRITGFAAGSNSQTTTIDGVARKEIVIENDIAWRIDTLIDYLFGRSPVLTSKATDPARRALIEHVLRTAIEHNGGVVFFQQLALIGAVYGFVDVVVKFDADEARAIEREMKSSTDGAGPSRRLPVVDENVSDDTANVPPHAGPASRNDDSSTNNQTAAAPISADDEASARAPFLDAGSEPSDAPLDLERLTRIARCIRFEIVEPSRALPFLAANDWRSVEAYAQVYERPCASTPFADRSLGKRSWLERFLGRVAPSISRTNGQTLVVDLLTPTTWQRYEDEKLVAQGINALGRIPLVHIQNNALPFEYSGTSDVEPLVPLQDELNTRLSDRAHRITMQSFKMYLGKGIENFGQMPVAPGRMWTTDNDAAEVIEFGGDAASPSEDAHIDDIREAMDKTSSVTPIAAGALKARIGRLTSAAALRVTLLALLAKTERKRTTYGGGIVRICELALGWLDVAGLFQTRDDERRIELSWPSPLPQNDSERLAEAESKLRIGVDRATVLRELGY